MCKTFGNYFDKDFIRKCLYFSNISRYIYFNLLRTRTKPDGIKEGFSGLDRISKKEGQRSRSYIAQGYPINQLTTYGSDPMRVKENRAV